MPKQEDFMPVAELEALILARFNIEKGKQAELQARIQQRLGRGVIQKEKPEIIALENKFASVIASRLAYALKQMPSLYRYHVTPSPTFPEFNQLIPLLTTKVIMKTENDKLEDKERKISERFVKTTYENIFEMMWAAVAPCENIHDIYEECQRWVTTVLDLATEHGILPTELLALKGATDEITRRMFTKEEFTALSKRAVNKFVDIDILKKNAIQPILDIFAESDEEERREIERELEAQVIPQLREDIEKTRVIVNTFLSEEINRIYAVA